MFIFNCSISGPRVLMFFCQLSDGRSNTSTNYHNNFPFINMSILNTEAIWFHEGCRPVKTLTSTIMCSPSMLTQNLAQLISTPPLISLLTAVESPVPTARFNLAAKSEEFRCIILYSEKMKITLRACNFS